MTGLTIAMFVFAAAYIAATLSAPTSYRQLTHGVDDLCCQQYRKNWMMRSGYLGYAVLVAANVIYAFFIGRTPLYPSLLLFGHALLSGISALFGKKPFFRSRSFDEKAHHIHERLIQASFVFANSAMVLAWFEDDTVRRILHPAFAVTCVFLFTLHRLAPRYQGLYQKCLYLMILIWQALLFPHYF